MKALILDVDGVLNGHGVRGLDPATLGGLFAGLLILLLTLLRK